MRIETREGQELETAEIRYGLFEVGSPAAVDMDGGSKPASPLAVLIVYFKNALDQTFEGEDAVELKERLAEAGVPINPKQPTRSKVTAALRDAGFNGVEWVSETTVRAASGKRQEMKQVIERCGAYVAQWMQEGGQPAAVVQRAITDQRALLP